MGSKTDEAAHQSASLTPASFWQATWRGGRYHFALFAYLFGQGIYFVLLPALIRQLFDSESEATIIYTASASLNIWMQFLFLPLMGVLGDRFGRKKMLLLGAFGSAIQAAGAAVAVSPSTVFFIFIGCFIQGICGGFLTNVQSVVADISTMEERSSYYAALTVFGSSLSVILGSLTGAFLVQTHQSYNALMLVACAVELLLMVFVLLFCSETLELQARKPMDWKRANPVGSLIVLFKAPFVQGVMAILGVVAIALACFNAITYFYISHRYGGGTTEYGIAQALWAASAVFSSGLSAAISRRTSERITLLVGMFLGAVASVGCAMAPTLLVFYVSITCFGLIMMAYPAYLAIISKQVAATRQAEVQSGAYAFALACQGLGVLMMGGIFALTIDASPEMPWMVWAICGLLLLLACFAAIPYLRLHPDDKVRIVDEQVQVYADESNESTSLIGDDVRCR